MTAGKYGTNFLESEAILAMQENDTNEVDRVLSQMTEVELDTLKNASLDLAHRAIRWMQAGGAEL